MAVKRGYKQCEVGFMRHLIDTYVQADKPRKVSQFDNLGLLDLIVKTGIAETIAQQLAGLRGNRGAIAETIENNVRRKIIKEQLNDPAFFEKMSKLLDEIIADRKAKAIEYEEYLKRVAELVKQVAAGHADSLPASLQSAGRRALYNNLNHDEELALRVHNTVMETRPDDWLGMLPRERVIKAALFGVLQDADEVERVFEIVKAQAEYH